MPPCDDDREASFAPLSERGHCRSSGVGVHKRINKCLKNFREFYFRIRKLDLKPLQASRQQKRLSQDFLDLLIVLFIS